MAASDVDLWEQWQARRSADAFMELVLRHSAMVYATCRRVLGNAADAEDVAQECFVELMRAHVRVDGSLAPWLYTVAYRRSLDKARADLRRRQREARYAEASPTTTSTPADEVSTHVDAAIAELPDALRAAVIARFLEGKTHKDIASAQGISESTVRYRIEQAVEHIRHSLKQRGITLTAVLLTALLESELAVAAPATLSASIAKLAIGAVGTPAAGSFSPWTGLAAKGAWLLMGIAIAVGVVLYMRAAPPEPEPSASVRMYNEASIQEAVTDSPLQEATPAVPVTLPASEYRAIAQTVENPASISGAVMDEGGFPIAGATVALATWASGYDYTGLRVWSTTTDSEGLYTLTGFTHAPPHNTL